MQPRVTGHLGMEGRGKQPTLPNSDRVTRAPSGSEGREHRRPWSDGLDPGRSDEDRVERTPWDADDVDVLFEGVHLPAESVTANRDVDSAERFGQPGPHRSAVEPVGEQDHAGAGPEGRQAGGKVLPERLEQPELAGQLDHRGGLATRQHDAVDVIQFRRPADRAGVCADRAQRGEMLAYVTLQSENADARGEG